MASLPVVPAWPRAEFVANGTTATYPFGWLVPSAGELAVYRGGARVFTGWTASGIGNAAGGKVIFDPAPAKGEVVVLARTTVLARDESFATGLPLPVARLNDALDRAVLRDQDLAAALDRTVRLHPGAPSVSLILPAPVPGWVLGWDDSGGGLINIAPDAVTGVSDGTAEAAAAAAGISAAQAADHDAQAAAHAATARTARDGAEVAAVAAAAAAAAIVVVAAAPIAALAVAAVTYLPTTTWAAWVEAQADPAALDLGGLGSAAPFAAEGSDTRISLAQGSDDLDLGGLT